MSRREAVVVGAVVAVALVVRAWGIQDVALQHYDEGTFALAGLVAAVSGAMPDWLAHYAPPLFPALLGVLFRVVGPSDIAVLLVNVVLSSLTVLAVWYAGRRWFNPRVGVAAAILLALNESDIILARSGLTDTLFALLFVVALVQVHEALERGGLRRAVVAGVFVGLAWNTKYHGWFVLVVAAISLAVEALRRGDGRRPGRLDSGVVRTWLTVAGVATLCFVPWALMLSGTPGGFADVVTHYRDFISLAPLGHALRYASNELFLEGWLTRASVPAALFGALLVATPGRPVTRRFALGTVGIAALAAVLGGAGAMLVLSALAAPRIWRWAADGGPVPPGTLLLAWLGLWIVAAPFYYPYARLLLPFTVATTLASAVLLEQLVGDGGSPEATPARPLGREALAGSAVVAVALVSLLLPDSSNPWRPTPEMREIAAELNAAVPPDSPLIVVGEPALQFYLYQLGRATAVGATPVSPNGAGFVVAGLYAEHVPEAEGLLPPAVARAEPLTTFSLVPSEIRLLDDYESAEATRYREEPDDRYDLRLWSIGR